MINGAGVFSFMILPPGNNLIWLYRLKWNVAADICINPARAHQGAQEEKQNSSFAHQCHHSLSSTVQVVERSSRQEVSSSLKLQILNLGVSTLVGTTSRTGCRSARAVQGVCAHCGRTVFSTNKGRSLPTFVHKHVHTHPYDNTIHFHFSLSFHL